MDEAIKKELVILLEKCLEWIEMELRFPRTGADFAPPRKEITVMIEKLQDVVPR